MTDVQDLVFKMAVPVRFHIQGLQVFVHINISTEETGPKLPLITVETNLSFTILTVNLWSLSLLYHS